MWRGFKWRSRLSPVKVLILLLLGLSFLMTGRLLMFPMLKGEELESHIWMFTKNLEDYGEQYLESLKDNPLQTKVTTSVMLYAISDLIAQGITGSEYVDVPRVVRFCVFGGPIWTTCLHFWYNYIDTLFQPLTFWRTVGMVLTDQGLGSPIYIVIYYTADCLMRGQKLADIKQRLRVSFRKVLLSTWCFWVPAQLANFSLVPLELRILSVNVMALIWNIIFSMITQPKSAGSVKDDKPGKEKASPAGPYSDLLPGAPKLDLGPVLPVTRSTTRKKGSESTE